MKDRPIERSFYYWKSIFKLNDFEQQRLDSLNVKTIYIKFFDVDWDDANSSAVPVAKLQNTDYKLRKSIKMIPTVFITNECIKKIDPSQTEKLANDIHSLIQQIIATNEFNAIAEIQIDCDWTALTKEKYFLLLKSIKKLWANTAIPVSATIRLHQIKFLSKTGVPPVDKGLLMCYNMGNLKNPATKNSILETEELKKYLGNLSDYPLPLDVALPLFNWKVLFRNNSYNGLIENLPDDIFTNAFTVKKENRFELLKDTLLQGYDLKKGDILRSEQSDYSEILSAAGEINKRLKNTQPRVSLYHLDSVILNKYTLHELETIYNSMR
ncbi:hypothetical protein [Ferruginibacter sp.]|nr:hypothetical protein [Ferruginibacter sp.]